jgi:hypothetical protein
MQSNVFRVAIWVFSGEVECQVIKDFFMIYLWQMQKMATTLSKAESLGYRIGARLALIRKSILWGLCVA